MIATGIILGILLSIVTTIATWRYSRFFLSRRDYYVYSKYDLFKKRLSMSLSAGGVVLFVFILLAGNLNKKGKQPNTYLNHSDTVTPDKSVKKKNAKPKRKQPTNPTTDTTFVQTTKVDE